MHQKESCKPMSEYLRGVPERVALEALFSKLETGLRLTADDALLLYQHAPLGWLGLLADGVRRKRHGLTTWYNRNFHIEPTNRCIYNCRFCSYNEHNSAHVWDYSVEEIASMAASAPADITEIHIVGGVAPGRGTNYYVDLLRGVRKVRPNVSIKAYSAIEISYMAAFDKLPITEVLKQLVEAGMDAIPGGGAEIFDPEVRKKICPEKDDAARWLEVHKTAHNLGIPTNATMLYGHIEQYAHRVDHMEQLRNLQDETNGFLAFIPLKFKHANNPLSDYGEVAATEDLRNFAVARLFLDNIPHLKAYWPMIGRDMAQLSQSFGVDDLDGTIHDSTRIYSAAGAEESSPNITTDALTKLIRDAGYEPLERDSIYQPVHQKD
jgi:aminodeoxyfutalosine synthase